MANGLPSRQWSHDVRLAKYGVTPEMVIRAALRGERWCNKCKAYLPNDQFGVRQKRCKKCNRTSWPDKRYGPRQEEFKHKVKHGIAKARSNGWVDARLIKHHITPDIIRQAAERGERWCSKHKAFLPSTEFTGHRWYCKKCHNASSAAQNGVCAICGGPDIHKKTLAVDHNHETGKLRGLLCGLCNMALHRLEKNHAWADKAVAYLKEYDQ
jgi:Recombination endonuclease VII